MDYSRLPEDIVEKIVTEHLENFYQLTAFSGVCKSWRTTVFRLRPPSLPGLIVSKTTASQSPPEAYYNSGQTHEFYPLTTLCPTTPPPGSSPPIPRATLSFFPSPSKISDAMGQRHLYLRRHHDLLTSFHDDELAAYVNPSYSDDDDQSSDDDEYDHYFYSYHYYGSDDEHFGKSAAHCLGSKDGWILRTLPARGRSPEEPNNHRRPLELYLLNPITGASIPLPPLQASSPDHVCCIFKAIISSSPDEEECHVFILSTASPQLAWCNVSSRGQGGWGFTSRDTYIFYRPHDAVYFGGKLYVEDCHTIYVIDHNQLKQGFSPAVRAIPFSIAMSEFPDDYDSCCEFYREERLHCHHLSHLDGELHVIVRSCNMFPLKFQVYKLVTVPQAQGTSSCDSRNANLCWREVRSLDGRAVFIGPHQSFFLPATATGRASGVRGNCI